MSLTVRTQATTLTVSQRGPRGITGPFGQVADHHAALKTVDSARYQSVLVNGHTAAFDGGGGYWVWTADTTSADDGGTILVPSGTRTGCWKRLEALATGVYNVKWFGARGDYSTALNPTSDDTLAIQAAFDAFRSRRIRSPAGDIFGGGGVYFPSGVYRCTQGIHMPSFCKIYGDNLSSSIVSFDVASGHGRDGFYTDWTSQNFPDAIRVFDLAIWNISSTNSTGGGIDLIGSTDCVVSECSFVGWKYGIILDAAETILIDRCSFGNFNSNGWDTSTAYGIWLALGTRHGLGQTVAGAANQITIRACQFNGPRTAIWHDDGIGHWVSGCNSESSILARITGSQNITHTGWTQEGQGSLDHLFEFDNLASQVSELICTNFRLSDNFFGGSDTHPLIRIGYYANVGNFTWDGNHCGLSPVGGAIQAGTGPNGETDRTCHDLCSGIWTSIGEPLPSGHLLFDQYPASFVDLNYAVEDQQFTIATLPATQTPRNWRVGHRVWVLNGRKLVNGTREASGAGTGALAYWRGNGIWAYFSDDSQVVA